MAGRVDPPPYDPRIDPTTHILNPRGIARYSPELANSIGRLLDASEFPIVLGGDCSILLGRALLQSSTEVREGGDRRL